ncbi:hypothetical protein Clacol_006114 [Clathrus columnatus]|uniref:Uncharacterized protein n=1 Tax=Clathrus columnatus TaxID=1419009 RepID=A0AAV5AFY1_9AGAM|nr:hypothetical protein Clacol_006114 [Clathrus columnatus]
MSWTQKYGPFFFLNVGGKPAIVIGSHKVATDLLEKRGGIYSGRPRYIVADETMTGGLVFAFRPYADSCRRMRRASHEVFSHQVAKNYHKLQSLEAVLLVKDLFKTPEFYIRHIHRATASSLLSALYGLPPCLDPFSPTLVLVNEVTETVLDAAAPGRYLVESFPFLKYLPSRLCNWKRYAESVFLKANDLFQSLYKEVENRIEMGEVTPSVTTSLVQDPIHKDLTSQEKAWVAGTL